MVKIYKLLGLFSIALTLANCSMESGKRYAAYEINAGKVKSITVISDWRDDIRVIEFDEKGNLIYSEDNLIGKTTNDNGAVSYKYYNPIYDGDSQEEIWIYNSIGLLIELSTPYGTEEYEYDKKFRLIRKTDYAEGNIGITEYEYDKDGSLTHTYHYEAEETSSGIVKIESTRSSQQYIINSNDDNGNWINRTVMPSWGNRYIESREITYWK